jgi:hypothetical protein
MALKTRSAEYMPRKPLPRKGQNLAIANHLKFLESESGSQDCCGLYARVSNR